MFICSCEHEYQDLHQFSRINIPCNCSCKDKILMANVHAHGLFAETKNWRLACQTTVDKSDSKGLGIESFSKSFISKNENKKNLSLK